MFRWPIERCDFSTIGAILTHSPGLGELQPQIGEAVRTFSAKKYVIFFQRLPDGIEVLRVAHGSRDWSNLF